MSAKKFIELIPAVQNYAWGIKGSEGFPGRLWSDIYDLYKSAFHELIPFDESKIYAELWYGTHPKGPNYTYHSGEKQIIQKLPDYLERDLCVEPSLPYLMKVIGCQQPLSIQVHPDIRSAQLLHQKYPDQFPDANHKPEFGIALSSSAEALCGFRPWTEIAQFFNEIEELNQLVEVHWIQSNQEYFKNPGQVSETEASKMIKHLFEKLLTAQIGKVIQFVKMLQKYGNIKTPLYQNLIYVVNYLHSRFPEDPGCLAPILLNYFVIKQGDCLNIPVNTVHAYLKGEILECMASSDNVIRAGLTPKFKNFQALTEIASFVPCTSHILQKKKLEIETYKGCSSTQVYQYYCGAKEFEVKSIRIAPGDGIRNISIGTDHKSTPGILVVINGMATVSSESDNESIQIKRGHALLIQAGIPLNIQRITETAKSTDNNNDLTSKVQNDYDINHDFVAFLTNSPKIQS